MNSRQYPISRAKYRACIFDLDGVVTTTARLHAVAWKEVFDDFLQSRSRDTGFTPFDIERDYYHYVDGLPRYDGVKNFLDSRGIHLPYGSPGDSPDTETICGLGNRKNQLFNQFLQSMGVDVFDSSVDLIFQVRSRGFRTAVVSSSKNCQTVLDSANIGYLFDTEVDGIDIEHHDLKGKPEPDSFWEAARMLDVDPSECVLFEDALSGVRAGKKGGFGLVVGIDRRGDAKQQFQEAGADLVVNDLSELSLDDYMTNLPDGLEYFEEIRQRFEDRRVAVFLDYDGTLTPIVSRPEQAVLPQQMRSTLQNLTTKCTVAIISGRGLTDARRLVDVEGLYFAGSHGFEIEGPQGLHMEVQEAAESIPLLDRAETELQSGLESIPGAQVERKKYSLAVHYRNVDPERESEVEQIVDRLLQQVGGLRKGHGKKVFELRPDIDWDKGEAVLWLLRKLELDQYGVVPIYIGDDITDEDAFRAFARRGITLVVGKEQRLTSAKYRLESVEEVQEFLDRLQTYLRNWNTWSLDVHGYLHRLQGHREALCTLGNGYFATRGAAPEHQADSVHYPGTYLAGGYNRLQTLIAGRVVENEDLVNMPNWLPLTFRFPGEEWFSLDEVEVISYRVGVDLKNGVHFRLVHFRDQAGRETRLLHRRIVSMHSMHMAALESRIEPLNWSGEIYIRSALDGQVINWGVKRYQALNNKHLEPLYSRQIDDRTIGLKVRTNQSNIHVSQVARTEVFYNGKSVAVDRQCLQESGYVAQEFPVHLQPGQGVRLEKIMAMYTSRDPSISESFLEASEAVRNSGRFVCLLRQHTLAWRQLWRRFAVEVELNLNGNQEDPHGFDHYHYVQRTLHLYCFHLLQSASMHSLDIDVGMPARGWHGEAYRGHIFWDEIIIFPYLTVRAPQITRTLLMYRYRRMGAARQMARELGFKGAMFPWQSGSNGREETQSMHLNPKSGRWIPDKSHLQRHINVALVYNIWQYCQISGDFEFLSFYGAEMILEIARFWSSITVYNEDLDRFEIHGVMGPDEFHEAYPGAERPGLSNNAYTNVMVVFVMNRALELQDILPQQEWDQLCERLDLRKHEIDRWVEISRKMRVVFHGDGIISQFEGYDQLEEFDWEGYKEKYGNIQRLDRILEAEGDSCNRYKASKQADVLMLFYLFSAEYLRSLFQQIGYDLQPEDIPKNIEYYLQRTSNGSSLSYVVHSWVAARRDRRHSWQMFEEALKTDVEDVQGGTTPEGIHLGAMSGSVDIVQRCFTGLEARGNILRFNPSFPDELNRVCFHMRYRGHWLDLDINSDRIRIEALQSGAEPVHIQVRDESFELEQGKTIECSL